MKRVLYILGILGIVAAVVAVGYLLRNRGAAVATESGGNEGLPLGGVAPQTIPRSGGLPAVGASGGLPSGQKFGVITDNPVRDFFVDAQNNVTVVQPDGQVVKITGGKVTTLSATTIANLASASFSYDGQKILVVFGDPAAPQTSVFDVAPKTWRPLTGVVKNPAWSPNDYRIAYFLKSGAAVSLATLDLKNTKAAPQTLLRLHGEDAWLTWPAPNKIILSDKPSAMFSGSAWSFDLKTKTLLAIAEDKLGLETIWNKKADRGLLFMGGLGNHGGSLEIVDGHAQLVDLLAVKTLVSKCTFSEETQSSTQATATSTTKKVSAPAPKPIVTPFLICGFPRDQKTMDMNPLPDAYYKKILFTTDDVYKINLMSGEIKSVFADPTYYVDATNLKVFNNKLFFVNRFDERLYAVSLGN